MTRALNPIPMLDPTRYNSLMIEGLEDEITVYHAKWAFKEKDLAACTFNVLLAFRNSGIFPWLVHSELDFEQWEIHFWESPFRSLRIRKSTVEGVVNIYAFGKVVHSFNILESPRVWQHMVKWIWHYGWKRQRAAAALKEKEQQQGQPANESELFPQPSVRQALGMANPNAQAQKSPPIEGTECIEEAPCAAEDITNGFGILNLLEQNNEMLEKAPAGVENSDLDTTGWSHQHCVS